MHERGFGWHWVSAMHLVPLLCEFGLLLARVQHDLLLRQFPQAGALTGAGVAPDSGAGSAMGAGAGTDEGTCTGINAGAHTHAAQAQAQAHAHAQCRRERRNKNTALAALTSEQLRAIVANRAPAGAGSKR